MLDTYLAPTFASSSLSLDDTSEEPAQHPLTRLLKVLPTGHPWWSRG